MKKLLTNLFRIFAERECKGVSTLYANLCLEISQDEDLLRLASKCRERQPIPNLFLGAIHYLLLINQDEELCAYYPSISKKESTGIPIALVKEFCERRSYEITKIIQTKIVQTNAINRAAYLMPIISSQFKSTNPVNIVDIGTSSGLTMNADLYEYDYGDGHRYGKSSVKINSRFLGDKWPDFEGIVHVSRKIGIDQHPLDLTLEDNAIWLKALIWPDNLARFERLEAAIDLATTSHIELIQASNSQDFRRVIDQISQQEELLIYHTHVLYQFTQSERKTFRAMINNIGTERNFTYLAVEGSLVFDRQDYGQEGIKIELTTFQDGAKTTQIIGETDGHANWIRWKN